MSQYGLVIQGAISKGTFYGVRQCVETLKDMFMD